MKTLIVATSSKPPNWEEELRQNQRYRIEYLYLAEQLPAPYMDYDPPWMHGNRTARRWEEKLHIDLYWAREIARKAAREGFELVISMSERIAAPLALFLDRKIKHAAILLNPLSPRWLFFIKTLRIHHKWHKIITYSHAEAGALQRELHVRPEKFYIIGNYIDVDFFDPLEVPPSGDQPKFIMSQGLANRDYPTLIRALRQLPHVECHISAVSAWDKHNANFGGEAIPDNILLKSYNHPFVIREALANCYFSVIPIRPEVGMWCSGSTSVLQAQAMGKPIVVTNLLGIAEYVRDGQTGYLVDGGDPRALASVIDELWHAPNKVKAMGEKGQAWVRENFSLEYWTQNMMRLVSLLAE